MKLINAISQDVAHELCREIEDELSRHLAIHGKQHSGRCPFDHGGYCEPCGLAYQECAECARLFDALAAARELAGYDLLDVVPDGHERLQGWTANLNRYLQEAV